MGVNNINSGIRVNSNFKNTKTVNKNSKDKDLIFDLNKNNEDGGSENTVNNDLDKNAFLHLLTTQLANQDPLDPMDDREFIAQLAQFSSLEQMNNLNDKAADMINAIDFLTAQTIEGGVITANEIYKIKLGLEEYFGINFDDLIDKNKPEIEDKDEPEIEKPEEENLDNPDKEISVNEEIKRKMILYRLNK